MPRNNDAVKPEDIMPKGFKDRQEMVDAMSGVVKCVVERRTDSRGKPLYSNGEVKNVINGTGKVIANDLLNFELAKHQRVQGAKTLSQPKAVKKLPRGKK